MFGLQLTSALLAFASGVLAIPPPVPAIDAVAAAPKQVNISLPIDHFNKSETRKYSNRYWFEDRYYKPGGPVILYDIGEGPGSDSLARTVCEQSTSADYYSAPNKLAQLHNGIVIAWEHRYFGYSLPCPLGSSNLANVSASCGYQYLTIDQALEDVVYFANKPNFPGYNSSQLASLAANKTPWIVVGGSYPGARAAWLRQRNPETIYASWASSAVVAPLEDGSSYFNTQARTRYANCSADMSAALGYIDGALGSSDPAVALDMRRRVATTLQAIDNKNTTEVSAKDASSYSLEELTPELVGLYSYGFQSSGARGIRRFCDSMEAFNLQQAPNNASISTVLANKGDAKPTSNGLKGQGATGLQLAHAFFYAAYAPYSAKTQQTLIVDPNGNLRNKTGVARFAKPMPLVPRDEDPIPPAGYGDGANWPWIVQNEFGVYEASSQDYFKYQSGMIELSKWENQSTTRAEYIAMFADAGIKNIRQHPNVTQCLKYGGWNINPSNVMWTTGTWDPWRPYTPLTVDQELGAPLRLPPTTGVAQCNVAPSKGTPFGLVYEEGMHAADLFGPSSGTVGQGVAAFNEALLTWLPCFKPH